jgi:HAE1 family hydrophobic/amphiphilic exporter-1
MENGVRPMQAAIFGTSEMGLAISASILTTIAVFLPMVFMGGITGVLFKQLALITSITLIGSLFAAMTLTPMLSSRLLKEKGKQTKYRSRVFILSEKIYTSVENRYRKLLEAVTGKPVLTVAITLLITVLSFIAAKGINSDYIPMMDTGDISGYAELPVGTNILEVSRISKKIEDIIYQEVPAEDMLSVYTISGQTERGLLSLMGFKEAKNNIVIGVKLNLPDEREYSSINLAEKIRHRLELIPEIEKLHIDGNSLLEKASLGNSSPIEIKIFGADLTTLNSFSKEIESRMKAYSGLSNVQNTADDGKLELQINTDRDKLRFYGLTQAQVGLAVRHAIFGAELTTKFKENNDEYDIIVQYDKKFVNDINNLGSVLISSLKGQQIPLSAVAEIVEVRAPIEVKREAQQRVVYISGDLAEGVALGTAVKVLKPMIEGMTKPEGIEIEFGGQYEEQQSAFKQLKIMFLIGIILVYMIMASQFGNLLDPFIIMFAIPFAVVGVIWAFLLTGETLSVISFIGLIMLVGIVVNNGIVLVNYTGLLRKRGMTVLEAVIESGYSRLRPVLMTAVTTILGMLPMAMSSGLGSSLWKPLGITVIGGLVISTLITLILIPVLYLLFHHREVGSEVTK